MDIISSFRSSYSGCFARSACRHSFAISAPHQPHTQSMYVYIISIYVASLGPVPAWSSSGLLAAVAAGAEALEVWSDSLAEESTLAGVVGAEMGCEGLGVTGACCSLLLLPGPSRACASCSKSTVLGRLRACSSGDGNVWLLGFCMLHVGATARSHCRVSRLICPRPGTVMPPLPDWSAAMSVGTGCDFSAVLAVVFMGTGSAVAAWVSVFMGTGSAVAAWASVLWGTGCWAAVHSCGSVSMGTGPDVASAAWWPAVFTETGCGFASADWAAVSHGTGSDFTSASCVFSGAGCDLSAAWAAVFTGAVCDFSAAAAAASMRTGSDFPVAAWAAVLIGDFSAAWAAVFRGTGSDFGLAASTAVFSGTGSASAAWAVFRGAGCDFSAAWAAAFRGTGSDFAFSAWAVFSGTGPDFVFAACSGELALTLLLLPGLLCSGDPGGTLLPGQCSREPPLLSGLLSGLLSAAVCPKLAICDIYLYVYIYIYIHVHTCI